MKGSAAAPMDSRRLYLRLLSYVRPYAKVFGLAILGMVAAASTEPLFPALIKPLLDSGFGTTRASLPPIVFAGAILGIFLLRGILTFSSSYCVNWVANKVVLDLRAAMFARLVRLPASFHADHSSGSLLSKIAYDVTGVTGAATNVLTVLVKDSIAVVGLLGWLLYLNWKLTLIAMAIAPPIAFAVRVISRRMRQVSRGVLHSIGNLVSALFVRVETPADLAQLELFASRRLDLELNAISSLTYYAELAAWFEPIQALAWVLAAMMAGAALFGAANTLNAAVQDRVRELATLRALGYRGVALVAALVQEGLLLASAGGLVGLFAARWLAEGAAIGIAMGAFRLEIGPAAVLTAAAGVLALGLFAALPAALRVLRLPVALALKES